MMKRSILIAFWAMVSVCTYSADRLQIVFNYTNGIYNGATYNRIIVDEEDFIKDKARYEGRFFAGFSQAYSGVAYFPDTINSDEPILLIDILQVAAKGRVSAEITLGEEKMVMTGRGGVFGTFLNLFGDGMYNLGKNIAQYMCSGDVKK